MQFLGRREPVLFGKRSATFEIVLATTFWIVFSVSLIPVLGIGVFLLPLSSEIPRHVKQRIQGLDLHTTKVSQSQAVRPVVTGFVK